MTFNIKTNQRVGNFKKRNSVVLVFAVGMLCLNMREERSLVEEDLRTVDALQVGSVGQLGVSGHHVFLQLVCLAERLLAVIAHVQVLLQVSVSSCSLLPTVPLTPQGKVLSVLAVSLSESGRSRDLKIDFFVMFSSICFNALFLGELNEQQWER